MPLALFEIQNLQGLIRAALLINGKMRTPKIEVLHRLIGWLNVKANINIPLLGLDTSDLDSKAWLAGMCDGDSYFQISLVDKGNGLISNI